jgi:hypothetical protein
MFDARHATGAAAQRKNHRAAMAIIEQRRDGAVDKLVKSFTLLTAALLPVGGRVRIPIPHIVRCRKVPCSI